MVTQIRGANTGVNTSGFANPGNVTADDSNCASCNGSAADTMYSTYLAGSINPPVDDDITYEFRVIGGDALSGGFGRSVTAYVSQNGGSNYCSGHDLKVGSFSSSSSCASAGDTGWIECSHPEAPKTEAAWEGSDNRIKIIVDQIAGGSSNSVINYIESRATYVEIAVPDSQNLISATTPDDSMILITRNGTYPNGNGDPVDSWEVWRSTTSGGAYSELATGLTATTYNDWSVDGGETWYYKAKFTNMIGDSALSTTPVNATATTAEITKTSNTTILVIDEDSRQVTRIVQRAEKDSKQISREVKAVKSRQVSRIVQRDGRASHQISRTNQRAEKDSRSISRTILVIAQDSRSISRTIFILQELTKTSDSWIMKIGEISRVSNTTISKFGLEIVKTSDTAIFREGFATLDITSDARIKNTFKETIISDSRIKNIYEQNPTSDSTIFRSQYGDIEVSSDTRIVLEGTIILPPILSDSRIKTTSEFTKTSDTFIVLGQEITKLSDTAIFQADYGDIIKTSDTAIFRAGYNDITKLSDVAIFKSGLLIDKLSDTRILRPGGYMYPLQDQEKTSDTRIFVPGQKITKKSLTRIKDDTNDILKLSDTLIMLHPVINKTSDTKIKFSDNVLLISSSTRIKNTGEVSTLSDAAIFRSQYGDITKLSDTLILREPIIDKTSDTTIVKLFEFSGIPSDTYIINVGTQIDINSDTAIFRAGYGHIIKESRTAIKTDTPLEITKLSNTRIKKTVTLNKVSDTAIRRDRSPMVAIFRKSRQL